MSTFSKHYKRLKASQGKRRWLSNSELEDLMMQIDLPSLMDRLGIRYLPNPKDGVYCGYCPDHHLRKGSEPDKPKWYISSFTGKTFCHTEGHVSNIVDIVRNLTGVEDLDVALDNILNGSEFRRISSLERRVTNVGSASSRNEERLMKKRITLEESIKKMESFFNRLHRPSELYDYFAKDGITAETIDRFGIFYCDSEYYEGRAVIPFLNSSLDVCGFVAVDIFGKEAWIKRQCERYESIYGGIANDDFLEQCDKRYRKALYAPGFSSDSHLYGLYEGGGVGSGVDYVLLVEGERDCLKMLQEGIPCLSIHGTHVSVNKAIKLKSFNVPIILGFDMDEAGRQAQSKAGQFLINSPYDIEEVFSVDFPDGKDPKKFSGSEMHKILEGKTKVTRGEFK